MSALEHRAQIPPREFRHDTVLAFLGDDAASSGAIRLDKPAMIGAQHAARVPSEFMRRLENDHAAGDGRAERLPLEFSAGRKVRGIATKKVHVGAVAVPFGPFGGANKPSPDAVGRRGDRDLIARIYR